MTTETKEIARQPTQVEIRKAQARRFETVFNGMADRLQKILPDAIGAERFGAILLNRMRQTPKLLECTEISILGGMFKAASLGLDFGSDQCYLIPRKNNRAQTTEATFQVSYKGILAMVRRTDAVKAVYAMPVYDEDFFDYQYGSEKYLKHKPKLDPQGMPMLYYAMIEFTNGGNEFIVWSTAQIEAHRDKFSDGYKYAVKDNRRDSVWHLHPIAMACKTILKALCKNQDISTDVSRAMHADGMVSIDSIPADVPKEIQDQADEWIEDVQEQSTQDQIAADIEKAGDAQKEAQERSKN